ncbi:MAG: response regulator [Bacteroidetes bacterium]|nr:response regulator [Bacteroidota bacterium]
MDKDLLIFIVDDDPMQLMMLEDHLSKFKHFKIKTFATGEECLAKINEKPDIIVLDFNLDSVDRNAREGLDILKEIKEINDDIDVVMLSGQDKMEVAVNTMKYGAFDYVVKNESAFVRVENAIYNIIKKNHVEGEANRYKKMMYAFALLFVASTIIVIFAVYLGWMKGGGTDVVL